jgi:hypothetical protein
MLIPLADIKIIFDKLLKRSAGTGETVVILVSFDVDSLCAAIILSVQNAGRLRSHATSKF